MVRFHRGVNLAPVLCSQYDLGSSACSELRTCGEGIFYILSAKKSPDLPLVSSYFFTEGRTSLYFLRTGRIQRASKTSIVDRRIKKCRTMKTNNNISIRRGRASISSLNRIKRVLLWAVGIIGAILGLVLWVFLRPIFRGVGWVVSLISALMIIYWLLTL